MKLHPRLEVTIPPPGKHAAAGHGLDKYGNRYLQVHLPFLEVTVFPFPRFQQRETVPPPGEHPWIDAAYWGMNEAGSSRSHTAHIKAVTALIVKADPERIPGILSALWRRGYDKGFTDAGGASE